VNYHFLPILALIMSTCAGYAMAGDETGNAAEAYAAARAEWDSNDKQLDDLAAKYREALPAEREEIRTQYGALVDKANAMIPRLRETGIAAYKESPNQDPELAKLLIGLVANDVRHDLYDNALELAKLLIDNECEEKAVYGQAGIAAYCLDDFTLAQQYLSVAKDADALDNEGLMYQTDVAFAKKLLPQ